MSHELFHRIVRVRFFIQARSNILQSHVFFPVTAILTELGELCTLTITVNRCQPPPTNLLKYVFPSKASSYQLPTSEKTSNLANRSPVARVIHGSPSNKSTLLSAVAANTRSLSHSLRLASQSALSNLSTEHRASAFIRPDSAVQSGLVIRHLDPSIWITRRLEPRPSHSPNSPSPTRGGAFIGGIQMITDTWRIIDLVNTRGHISGLNIGRYSTNSTPYKRKILGGDLSPPSERS